MVKIDTFMIQIYVQKETPWIHYLKSELSTEID